MSSYKDFGWQSTEETDSHSYLLPAILHLLASRKDKRILDIGCGNGATVCRLIEHGYDVWGVDASESGIALANKCQPGRFFVQDISTGVLPAGLANKHFDIVISTEVIEHIYAPRAYMCFIKAAFADSGGELIISTP